MSQLSQIWTYPKENAKVTQTEKSTTVNNKRHTSAVKPTHKVNSTSLEGQSDSISDSDEAGLVVKHAMSVLETTNTSQWIIDSGATSHMCNV